MPIDLLLGIAIGASVFYAIPPDRSSAELRTNAIYGVALITAVVLTIILGTVLEGGTKLLLDNLSQNHTREGSPLVRGSH